MIYADPIAQRRVKKGELRTIRADLVALGRFKEPQLGARVSVTVTDAEGGSVVIAIPDNHLSDFATAALQAVHVRNEPDRQTPGGPVPMVKARAIVPDQISVLDPAEAGAPPEHAVLEIRIGNVPLQFSAHRENWKQILDALTKLFAPSRQRQ